MWRQECRWAYYTVLENTPFLQDCCHSPADWRDIWIFLITSCIEHTAIPFTFPGEIWARKTRTETADDTFSLPRFFFFCAWIYDRPFSFLHLCRSKQEVAPALTSKTVRLWIKKPMKRRRENINKNIKRRHLLFDCCVHLYTSLHHYGLFSLQIKPKIVQITRRLKSF